MEGTTEKKLWRFAPDRCPSHFRSGQAPPTFKFVPAPLGRVTYKGRRRIGKRKGKGRGRQGDRRDRSPYANSWIRPCLPVSNFLPISHRATTMANFVRNYPNFGCHVNSGHSKAICTEDL